MAGHIVLGNEEIKIFAHFLSFKLNFNCHGNECLLCSKTHSKQIPSHMERWAKKGDAYSNSIMRAEPRTKKIPL